MLTTVWLVIRTAANAPATILNPECPACPDVGNGLCPPGTYSQSCCTLRCDPFDPDCKLGNKKSAITIEGYLTNSVIKNNVVSKMSNLASARASDNILVPRINDARDAFEQYDGLFSSHNNLRIKPGGPLVNSGLATPEITHDFEGDSRDTNAPDVGADEL